MKKVVAVALVLAALIGTAEAERLPQAEDIYNTCLQNTPSVQENDVLSGNIKDVVFERQFRKCLKNQAVLLASTFLREDEAKEFDKSLTTLETATFDVYKSLIFCSKNSDDFSCHNKFKEDTSLGKLLLEKQLTTQVYQILKDILNAQQGQFEF